MYAEWISVVSIGTKLFVSVSINKIIKGFGSVITDQTEKPPSLTWNGVHLQNRIQCKQPILGFHSNLYQGSLYYQTKQGTVKQKSLKITMNLLLAWYPPKWVPFNDPCLLPPPSRLSKAYWSLNWLDQGITALQGLGLRELFMEV